MNICRQAVPMRIYEFVSMTNKLGSSAVTDLLQKTCAACLKHLKKWA